LLAYLTSPGKGRTESPLLHEQGKILANIDPNGTLLLIQTNGSSSLLGKVVQCLAKDATIPKVPRAYIITNMRKLEKTTTPATYNT
jgi:hypothetical protein